MQRLSCIDTYEAEDRVHSGPTPHNTVPALTKHPSQNVSSHCRRIAEAATPSQAPGAGPRHARPGVRAVGCAGTDRTGCEFYVAQKLLALAPV